MKIFLAPDTGDHMNWGCRVMGDFFLERLAAGGVRPTTLGSHFFYKPPDELRGLRSLADIERVSASIASGKLLPGLKRGMESCDLVLLNGENFIRPDVLRGRLLLLVAYLAIEVFKKPTILTNHTVEFGGDEFNDILKHVYPAFTEVHFREQTSLESAGRFVEDQRCRLIPDVAWAVPAAPRSQWLALASRSGYLSAFPDRAQQFDPSSPYITVCASSVFSERDERLKDAAKALARLCARLQQEVAPILFVATSGPEQTIFREIAKVLKAPVLGNAFPARQAVDVVGNATLHVGGRWHPAIFAATGGAPQVALTANNHKMNSLARQMEMEDPVFDVFALEEQETSIVKQAAEKIAAGTTLRETILERARQLGSEVDRYWSPAPTTDSFFGTAVHSH